MSRDLFETIAKSFKLLQSGFNKASIPQEQTLQATKDGHKSDTKTTSLEEAVTKITI